jgi:hypothetical protein
MAPIPIPAIPALAIARKRPQVPTGARSCVHDLTLAEIEHAMEGLPIRFERREEPAPSLFEMLLGESWQQLPTSLRRLHSVQDIESFSGRATVTRGSGLIARLIGLLFCFPKAGRDILVIVTKQRIGRGETWERNFAGRIFRSRLSASSRAGHCREAFIPFTYELELPVRDGSLHLPVPARMALRPAAAGLPAARQRGSRIRRGRRVSFRRCPPRAARRRSHRPI